MSTTRTINSASNLLMAAFSNLRREAGFLEASLQTRMAFHHTALAINSLDENLPAVRQTQLHLAEVMCQVHDEKQNILASSDVYEADAMVRAAFKLLDELMGHCEVCLHDAFKADLTFVESEERVLCRCCVEDLDEEPAQPGWREEYTEDKRQAERLGIKYPES